MFGQLGSILFERLKEPVSFSQEKSWAWEEHQIAGEKSKLQHTGIPLDTITLEVRFHVSFCTPEEEYQKLIEEANKLEPLPFITGEGDIIGKFVITNISREIKRTGIDGELVAVECEIKLKEYN